MATFACWDCGNELEAGDAYCRFCGQGQGGSLAWYFRPLWISVLTVLALGPFSLWLVWKTPRLGRRGKAAAAFLVLLYTAWLCWRAKRLYDAVMGALSGDPMSVQYP